MLEETNLDTNPEAYSLSDEAKKQIQNIIKNDQDQRQRTWSYYTKLRAENVRLYRDPKTQHQMMKDATALGDAFCDGDWDTWK